MRAGVLVAPALMACAPEPATPWEPGSPIPGLSAEQLALFEEGRRLFDRDFSEAEGLGPSFNQMRCSSCHDLPTVGGSGVERVLKATRWADGRCDPLLDEGGETVQPRITARLQALGGTGETVPPSATHTVDLVATSLYGMGLVEAVAEEEILGRARAMERDGGGISGRAGGDAQGRLARFGHKATDATLRGFIEGALLQEMGLTTEAHPVELTINGRELPEGADPAPDPEMGPDQVDALVAYVRFLAPPDRTVPAGREERRVVERGEVLFRQVECTSCHVPEFRTGSGAEPRILADRPVHLYSDLLLHDLGPDVEGICSASASPTEVRTMPLAGLRFRPLLMHDGGAVDFRDAIRRHGGQGAGSRERFRALSPGDQAALMAFLGTL